MVETDESTFVVVTDDVSLGVIVVVATIGDVYIIVLASPVDNLVNVTGSVTMSVTLVSCINGEEVGSDNVVWG